MLYFISRYYKGTINGFIDSWANDLRTAIRVIRYREIPFLGSLPQGVCLFADLERVRPWEGFFAARLCQKLEQNSPPSRILNDPRRYQGRFELLNIWHQGGINDFRAFRLAELGGTEEPRFPVFLRRDLDHRGSIGGLLKSRAELDETLAGLSLRDRLRRKRLMVVEYCDCSSSDALFRKYSAMNLGGILVPSHVYFSSQWLTKVPEVITEGTAREEAEFVESFPHREEVAKAFRLAGTDYGRIDYGVKDGRIQVWEINTNPIIVRPRRAMSPLRLASQSRSAELIARAFTSLSQRA